MGFLCCPLVWLPALFLFFNMSNSTALAVRRHITDSGGSAHWYAHDGTPQHKATLREARKQGLYPSVTSVLKLWPKPMLDSWKIERAISAAMTLQRGPEESDEEFAIRAFEHSKLEAKEAAAAGTELHDMMSVRATTGKWPTTVRWAKHQEAYEAFMQEYCAKLACSEECFVNHDHGYAGTIDLVAYDRDGRLALLDFKNQSVKPGKEPRFYPEYLMQMTAYRNMLGGDSGIEKPDAIISVVLNRDQPDQPALHEWPADEWNDAWDDFQACLALWMRVNSFDPRRSI